MSALEKALTLSVDSLIRIGAKVCVISDTAGLPIATLSKLDDEDAEIAFSALSSLVISTGDKIASELTGNFRGITVRTTGDILLSIVIDSEPRVLLSVIAQEELEDVMIHEMNRLKPVITKAIAGVSMELPERYNTLTPDKQRIKSFFESLNKKISACVEIRSLIMILISAKDDLFTLVNSGTVSYEMNRYAIRLEALRKKQNYNPKEFEKLKLEIKKAIIDWEKRLS